MYKNKNENLICTLKNLKKTEKGKVCTLYFMT